MENKIANNQIKKMNQQGAALATAIFVTILLTTAIIALLSAASNHSKNVTDVLSETKAFYAAENGLQAAINVLRNTTISYNQADQSQNLNGVNWLTYNYTNPSNGSDTRVVVENGNGGSTYNPQIGTAYSIFIEDPDNSGDRLTFNTTFTLENAVTGAVFCPKPTCVAPTIYVPNQTATDRTEITFNEATNTIDFTDAILDNAQLGSFTKTEIGNGASLTNVLDFRIDYQLTFPRPGLRNIRGKITQNGTSLDITFQSQTYNLLGGAIRLCTSNSGSSTCSITPYNITSNSTVPFYGYLTQIEPYRLRVVSTGYGPNGSKKVLEGFVQKDFFNNSNSPAPLMLQGPGAYFYGSSAAYNITGVDNVNGITIPAVGVTDQTSLNNVQGCNCNPAPAIVTDVPDWLSTPQNLDVLVQQLRNTAINSGRYYNNPSSNITNTGDYTTGTGITFCDGSCTVQNNADGGGILVVTGTLYTDVWRFKGLILVTGAGGWDRQGGGNRDVTGNVVIAPYDPANLNAGFLAPYYKCQGCGTSGINYDPITLDNAFNGTNAISNFMLGVAEK